MDTRIKRIVMKQVMRPLRSLLEIPESSSGETSLYRQVLSENIRRAFKGSYPVARIDYTRLLVSKGKLPGSRSLSVSPSGTGKLSFYWDDNSGMREAYDSDLLFIALFHRASSKWFFNIDAAMRSDCYLEMEARLFQGKLVRVYAGFISEDGRRVSTSKYLGELRIQNMDSGIRA